MNEKNMAETERDIEISYSCEGVVWREVVEVLGAAGLAYRDPDIHRKAFEGSYLTVFISCEDALIGFGRAISDGVYQAAIYDCAVIPKFQGKGVGSLIVEQLVAKLSGFNIILYAAPGKEGFYESHGFRKMKTGMALFERGDEMAQMGFTE